MKDHGTVNRLERLADAFENLTVGVPGLRLDRKTASPAGAIGWNREPNFSVWLVSQRSVAEVCLFVRVRGMVVEIMSASTEPTIRPVLQLPEVDLRRDYQWSVADFGDEMQMAALLLAQMQLRLAGIDAVEA